VAWQWVRSIVILSVFAGSVSVAGCGGNGGSSSVEPRLVSISISPSGGTINKGDNLQFAVTGTFSDGGQKPLTSVTWTSSNPGVATVTAAGLAAGVSQGNTTIQVSSGSVNTSVTLTVTAAAATAPTLVSIAVTPANSSVPVGQTQQFTAAGTFSDNSNLDLTNSVTWAPSNPTAVTISSAGLAMGVTAGQSTTISATQGSISGSTTLTVTSASAFAGVFTYHNDLSRTGQNLNETTLTPSNVNVNTFGKRFSQPVDGQIYAQPLYVPNVAVQGKGSHNVIFVVTEADSVYAFDADNNIGANASPLWKASLIDTAHGAAAGATPVSNNDVGGCTDLQPNIGVTATPVIDPNSGTMYVEAKSKENGSAVHRLHAIDITTGNEKFTPVVIDATVPGTGDGSSNGQLNFASMAMTHNSRPGLLLLNGIVYLTFASHCDNGPYHGWLFAYDTSSSAFARKGVYVTTPNGGLGGVWMSGAAPAADSNGTIFLATGNGTFDTTNVPATELGDSILKFNFSNGTLSLADYFTPFNQSALNSVDNDLGSGGILLLPDQPGSHPRVLVEAGKEGKIYLVDRDQMTANNQHFCSNCNSDTQIVQESGAGQVGGMWSIPACWNNTTYWWGSGDVLKSIPLSNGLLDFTHITSSAGSYGFPGATPSISANGTSNGIVWSIDSSQYGAPGPGPGPAVLHAHDATNVAKELWNSTQASNNRDTAGNAVKFTVPTIANAKVYIGTSAGVDVYGLL
jgi:Bacterial Ig-like domain (group 2)